MGQAGFRYNPISNRWELRGKGGRLIRAFDDGNQGVPLKEMILVGSSLNTGVGSHATAVATIAISNNPLLRGDVVYGNSIAALPSNMGVGGFVVPSNGLLHVTVVNPVDATATLTARGWDLYAIRKTGTS